MHFTPKHFDYITPEKNKKAIKDMNLKVGDHVVVIGTFKRDKDSNGCGISTTPSKEKLLGKLCIINEIPVCTSSQALIVQECNVPNPERIFLPAVLVKKVNVFDDTNIPDECSISLKEKNFKVGDRVEVTGIKTGRRFRNLDINDFGKRGIIVAINKCTNALEIDTFNPKTEAYHPALFDKIIETEAEARKRLDPKIDEYFKVIVQPVSKSNGWFYDYTLSDLNITGQLIKIVYVYPDVNAGVYCYCPEISKNFIVPCYALERVVNTSISGIIIGEDGKSQISAIRNGNKVFLQNDGSWSEKPFCHLMAPKQIIAQAKYNQKISDITIGMSTNEELIVSGRLEDGSSISLDGSNGQWFNPQTLSSYPDYPHPKITAYLSEKIAFSGQLVINRDEYIKLTEAKMETQKLAQRSLFKKICQWFKGDESVSLKI